MRNWKRLGNLRGMPIFATPKIPPGGCDGLLLLKMEPDGPDSPGEQGPILDGYLVSLYDGEMMRKSGVIDP